MLMRADGTGLRRIRPAGLACGGDLADPDAIGCHGPSWSPHGRKLAFAAGSDSTGYDIYTTKLDGTGLSRLTLHGGDDPDWSAGPQE